MAAWQEALGRLWHRDRSMMVRLSVLGALGLALVVAGSWPRGPTPVQGRVVGGDAPAGSGQKILAEERALDEEVAAVVQAIPGSGRVSVGVSLTRTAMTQYAGHPAQAVAETEPAVSGVVVVATGAQNPVVRTEITAAVETLLQLQSYQVLVLPDETIPVGGP